MAVGISLTREPRRYTLEQDRELPESERTVFLLVPNGVREKMRLQDMFRYEGDVAVNVRHVILERVKLALAGWENFRDMNGVEIKFDPANREANLEWLEPEWIFELSKAVNDISELGEAQEKN